MSVLYFLIKRKWSLLFLFTMHFLFSLNAHAVYTDRPGDYTSININRHLHQILSELPIYDPVLKTFTQDSPPSNKLRQEVKNLQTEWQKLYNASDFHDIIPPSRIRVLKVCDDLKKYKQFLKDELEKLIKRESFVDHASRQVKLRNLIVMQHALGKLGYELYKAFSSFGKSSSDVIQEFYDILKKQLKKTLRPQLKNPGQAGIYSTTAKNLGEKGLRYQIENLDEVTKEVMDYVRWRKFQPHELRDHEYIKKEIRIVIREFLKKRAKIELIEIRKRIAEINNKLLEYTAPGTLPQGGSKFTDYELLCEKIRALRDWKRRRVVALRIDPPKVQIKVGERIKFEAIGKYFGGAEFYFTNKVNWPYGNSFTGTKPGKFTIEAEYRSLTAIADVTVSTIPVCPSPKVNVPYVLYISENKAEGITKKSSLKFKVAEKKYSNRHEAGTVVDQFPNPGECVDPNTDLTVTVSLGQRETPSVPFEAKLDCGASFELSQNEILYPKICNVLVRGYHNSEERVNVSVIYDNSILNVFPDDQSAQPYLMYPITEGLHKSYYIFSLNISTTSTAPDGKTSAVVIVKQGSSEVKFPLTILILPSGREPSSETGVRPVAQVTTGSAGGSPDAFCVWRYKSFGDRPECFNFVRAKCNNLKYNKPKYELVGKDMTWRESGVRMADLGSYHDDAYGCHTFTETDAKILSALNITPGSVKLNVGNSISFTAIAIFSDGSTEIASGAQWSGDDGVADNTFTARKAGNFTITAKYRGISGSASIIVAEPVPTAIEISPRDSTININETINFTATVTFNDGHTETNPDGIIWRPGSSFIVTKAGEYTVTAEYRGKSDKAAISVQDFYGDAEAALQSCNFEKTRGLLDQMVASSKKAELEQKYQTSVVLENRLKAFVAKANGEYKSGNYRDAFSTLHDALNEVECDKHRDSINKKIAIVNKALLKPYNNAKSAIQACEFEKARSLIDQMVPDTRKTELEKEYQASVELENKLKAMVNQANGDYKSCNYDEVLAILNDALSLARCKKHIESIKNKKSIAKKTKAHEATTKRLHREANSLYKRKDYNRALAKLQQAYNHTECDRYKDSLSRMIAKIQGKRKPSPEEQVANKDCSRWPGSRAYWDDNAGQAKCGCSGGLRWNLNESACVSQYEYAKEYCAKENPGSYPKLQTDGRYRCECPSGYVLGDNKRCIKKRDPRFNRCMNLISKIRGFMTLYKMNPEMNMHIKVEAERIAQKARRRGCNQNQINQALGTGEGGINRRVERCPPGYYLGSDGSCTPEGGGTFGQ